jgi:hypothetical protein
MKLEIAEPQLDLLIAVLDTRISNTCPEALEEPPNADEAERAQDLNDILDLRDQLVEAKRSERSKAAWEGYAESRKVPANPPPAS